MIETTVEIYKNKRSMQRDMKKMQKEGWTVANIQLVPQGYNGLKTCCLGALFLPLALLGKKPEKYQVIYQREKIDESAGTVLDPEKPEQEPSKGIV